MIGLALLLLLAGSVLSLGGVLFFSGDVEDLGRVVPGWLVRR